MAGNLAGNSRRRPFIGCGQRSCLPETGRTAPVGRSVGQIVFGGRAVAPLPISRSVVSRSCRALRRSLLRPASGTRAAGKDSGTQRHRDRDSAIGELVHEWVALFPADSPGAGKLQHDAAPRSPMRGAGYAAVLLHLIELASRSPACCHRFRGQARGHRTRRSPGLHPGPSLRSLTHIRGNRSCTCVVTSAGEGSDHRLVGSDG
jgi:hypothetical protein